MPEDSFFYHVNRPGRYLGGEAGVACNGDTEGARTVAWFHPGRYEEAMADPGWRRGYFQLVGHPGIRCVRAIEFAGDAWRRLADHNIAPFDLDRQGDLRRVDTIVFRVPDVFAAAHIPAILHRLGLGSDGPEIGVLVDGHWAPRFLAGHIDWIAPAAGGWLSEPLLNYLAAGSGRPASLCDGRDPSVWDSFWNDEWLPAPLHPVAWEKTPRWVPRVEIGDDWVDVEMVGVGPQGQLETRPPATIVADALDGLRTTGVDGLRFCDSGHNQAALVAATLTNLSRVYNMRRVRATFPALSADAYLAHWKAYKPHLIKPGLRLVVDATADEGQLIDIGRQAFNAGWISITAEMQFGGFDECTAMLPKFRNVLSAWHRAVESFADKRLVRLEYRPAPLDLWADPPTGPAEDDVRRIAGEFRHFKEDASRWAAVGAFRIEEVMARNWLAAAGPEIWPMLAELNLTDPDDEGAPPFDWFAWMRQKSGLQGPPGGSYLKVQAPAGDIQTADTPISAETADVVTPQEHLFGRRKKKMGFSRRLTAPALMRMRLRFRKGLSWRLYSHLDVVRAIERAIRCSQIPVSYSEGFHPRMKISFGPPLPFGVISAAEYFDVVLTENYEPGFADRLAKALPEGLSVEEARGFTVNMSSLTETINEATFRAILPLEAEQAQVLVNQFMMQPDVQYRRPDRPDRKPFDPRKNLREISVEKLVEGSEWGLRVKLGQTGSIRPADWAMLLFNLSPEQLAGTVIERTALLVRKGGTVKTPLEVS